MNVPQRHFESPEPIEARVLHNLLTSEGTVLVTPNRRLAGYYKARFDNAQRDAGLGAWPSPDILPWSTFIERVWRGSVDAPNAPTLLSPLQAQLVWERIIRNSPGAAMLNPGQTARQAMEAWTTVCAWQLLPAMRSMPVSEDVGLFLDWVNQFVRVCREEGYVDMARLAEVWTQSLVPGQAGVPSRLLVAGFDIVTPQQARVLRKLAETGVAAEVMAALGVNTDAPAPVPPHKHRLVFQTDDEEILACAAWARRRIEGAAGSRIAIVVPDLRRKRGRFARALNDVLRPGERVGRFDTAANAGGLFNISLGQPLGEFGLVSDAMEIIELSLGRQVPFTQLSGLLRSPFTRGGAREMTARAGLDAVLRKYAPGRLTLQALRQLLQRVPAVEKAARATPEWMTIIADRGDAFPRRQTPPDWSRLFGSTLSQWGFPGEAPLDSLQHQVFAKFRESLEGLAGLQGVQAKMRADEALLQLRRIVTDTVFQAEDVTEGGAPIQVLGVLESGGQYFDAIWVCGLSDDTWPQPAKPTPFIPAGLQRAAGVPDGSAAASLALDQRITHSWVGSAPEVIFSHALREGDGRGEQARRASRLAVALVREVSDAAEMVAQQVPLARAMRTEAGLEEISEPVLGRLPPGTRVRGGARLLADQAACPFRAVVRHRIGAPPLEVPTEGLDAAERGNLLHRVLFLLWREIKGSTGLAALGADALSEMTLAAAERAVGEARAAGAAALSGRFADAERTRLARLALLWLEYERERGAFDVVQSEAPRRVDFSGVRLDLRLDRIDRLADGTHALIDYKTGSAALSGWLGARPDDPQLPLYFLTWDDPVAALAYARVRRGIRSRDFGFEGVSAVEGILPDVVPIEARTRLRNQGYTSWDVLTAQWEVSLAGLVNEFVDGSAQVDPKYGTTTCARCDLQAVCRIAETGTQSTPAAATEEVEPDD